MHVVLLRKNLYGTVRGITPVMELHNSLFDQYLSKIALLFHCNLKCKKLPLFTDVFIKTYQYLCSQKIAIVLIDYHHFFYYEKPHQVLDTALI